MLGTSTNNGLVQKKLDRLINNLIRIKFCTVEKGDQGDRYRVYGISKIIKQATYYTLLRNACLRSIKSGRNVM